MFASFRLSMTWLHTWLGLVLGFVLMVVFFFGSLSVFDREIDRWAIPSTRFEPQPMPSFDRVLRPVFEQVKPDADAYAANIHRLHDASRGPAPQRLALPADEYWAYTTHRDPVLLAGVDFRVPQPKDPKAHNHIPSRVTVDPRNGQVLAADQSLKIGSEFFYPLHYSLHGEWLRLGYWVVGLAAFGMLVALVSGVVMHRKLLRELFTFRRQKDAQRATLDLHNLTGVAALPFHFFFALTGLIIFAASVYLPISATLLKPLHDQDAVLEAQHTGLPLARSGVVAALASVDAMVAAAQRRWAERGRAGEVGFLKVHHLGDANSYVSIYRAGTDRVALLGDGMHFRASTGELLREDPPPSAAAAVRQFLVGLHLQHFEHWALRWLYLFGGLLGCVCLATGFIFFVQKRAHKLAGAWGLRVVSALTVASITGMLIATAAMLVANRLLPAGTPNKGSWEQLSFWLAWLLALAHAARWRALPQSLRAHPAWVPQCWAIAALAVSAVLLNGISTGDHLLKTLSQPYWPVAGVDLALLVCAAIAAAVARRLARVPSVPSRAAVRFAGSAGGVHG